MSMNLCRALFAVLTGCLLTGVDARAIPLELDVKEKVTVTGPAFVPFSAAASEALDQRFQSTGTLPFVISKVSGTGLKLAPALNGFEIGPKKALKLKKGQKSKILVFDYSQTRPPAGLDPLPPALRAQVSASNWGVSVVGDGKFTVIAQANGTCPSPVECVADEERHRVCNGATNTKCCEADKAGNIAKKCKSIDGKKCGCGK